MYTKEQMQTNNIHSYFTVNNDSLVIVSAVDLISVQIGQEHVSGKTFSPSIKWQDITAGHLIFSDHFKSISDHFKSISNHF